MSRSSVPCIHTTISQRRVLIFFSVPYLPGRSDFTTCTFVASLCTKMAFLHVSTLSAPGSQSWKVSLLHSCPFIKYITPAPIYCSSGAPCSCLAELKVQWNQKVPKLPESQGGEVGVVVRHSWPSYIGFKANINFSINCCHNNAANPLIIYTVLLRNL